MNKLKTSWIIWGMVMIAIVILLYFLGITLAHQNKPYKEKEEELVEIAKIYVESRTWYPTDGQSLKITINELRENGVIQEVKIKDDKCDGYIEITNNGIINYKTYLKCKNYQTYGYN